MTETQTQATETTFDVAALFQRDGSPVPAGKVVRADAKGRPVVSLPRACGRCGGSGRYSYCSMYGSACFGCNGTGRVGGQEVRLYTAAELERLNATAATKLARKRVVAEAAEAARVAEVEARRLAFQSAHADVFPWLMAEMGREAVKGGWPESEAPALLQDGTLGGFLAEMARVALRDAAWTSAQAAAVRKVMAARRAREAQAAAIAASSQHVGAVGQRLRSVAVTVANVYQGASAFGPYYIVTMHDVAGNVLVAKGGRFAPGRGDRLVIDATVKGHGSYREVAQTEVQRVVVQESIAAGQGDVALAA